MAIFRGIVLYKICLVHPPLPPHIGLKGEIINLTWTVVKDKTNVYILEASHFYRTVVDE